jgi:hypothetical protein
MSRQRPSWFQSTATDHLNEERSMTTIRDTTSGQWFRRVLWIGIVANLVLSIGVIMNPAAMLIRFSLPDASPLLWPRFSALLLILLSVFYMPAGIDPDRYRANAWMAVGARLVGVVFFLVFQDPVYRTLGMVDLVFFIPEVILLAIAVRAAPAVPAGATGASAL